MGTVTAKPNEYLVISEKGKLVNKGVAAKKFLLPGTPYVLVPSSQQEASFEMTQETRDGIPLRFKGIVIYHVADPVKASQLFDFTGLQGHEEVKSLINHVCLGELRHAVAHMTMNECIEQRKTTLTETVSSALQKIVQGDGDRRGWGITLDVVQVAQVFIVDNELRKRLEAETRNQIKVKSDISDVQAREAVDAAQIATDLHLAQKRLESERETAQLAQEKLRIQQDLEKANMQVAHEKLELQQELERARIEAETPNRLLQIRRERQVLQQELEKRRLEAQVQELVVQNQMILERAMHELKKEMLPIEQAPAIAAALAGLFKDANLSIYGDDSTLLATLGPLVETLAKSLKQAHS